MQALQRRADLLEVEVDRAVWSRGGRPFAGRAMRFGFAALFLGLALLIPDLTTRMIFAVTGVVALLFIGPIMDNRLDVIGRSIAAADRRTASRLLVGLDNLRVVKLFASHGWVALQRGRLNLVLGNGRAAAKSFADCARVLGQPELPALVSAQAHGLMLAGDRKEARPLLQQLEKRDQLSPRDRIDLGLSLLEDAGRAPLARAQLEAAREQLGGHPRVLAGLALAYARTDDGPGGMALLEAAEQADGVDNDEIATELVKRARKALRPVLEAAEKRQRKARVAVSAPAAARPTETAARAAKNDRKERREKKREKKRGGKADTGVSEPIAVEPAPVASQRELPSEAELADETTLPVVRTPEPPSRRNVDDEARRRAARAEADAAEQREHAEAERVARAEADAAEQRLHAEAEQAERAAQLRNDADRRAAEAEADAAKQRAEHEAAKQRAQADADAAAVKQRAEAEAEAAKQAAELEAAKQRAEAQAEAQRLAAEAAAVQRAAEEDAARWAAEAEKQRAAVAAAKQRAEQEAAKKRAEEQAEKQRADDEAAQQAARIAAAAAPVPVFLPPPLPEVAAPSVVAPPVVRAPSLAPSKPAQADAPAVDASGWDDLLGDGPAKS